MGHWPIESPNLSISATSRPGRSPKRLAEPCALMIPQAFSRADLVESLGQGWKTRE
jgi:hypothetical protein